MFLANFSLKIIYSSLASLKITVEKFGRFAKKS